MKILGNKKGSFLELPPDYLVDGSTSSVLIEGTENYGRTPLWKTQVCNVIADMLLPCMSALFCIVDLLRN